MKLTSSKAQVVSLQSGPCEADCDPKSRQARERHQVTSLREAIKRQQVTIPKGHSETTGYEVEKTERQRERTWTSLMLATTIFPATPSFGPTHSTHTLTHPEHTLTLSAHTLAHSAHQTWRRVLTALGRDLASTTLNAEGTWTSLMLATTIFPATPSFGPGETICRVREFCQKPEGMYHLNSIKLAS